MLDHPWFVGCDLGSSALTAALARVTLGGEVKLVGCRSVADAGLSRGRLVDQRAFTRALRNILEWAEEETGRPVASVGLTVWGRDIQPWPSSAELSWPFPVHIDQSLLTHARCRALRRPNAAGTVLATCVKGYDVDGRRVERAPVGRSARRLRVDFQSWVAPERRLKECVEGLAGTGVTVDLLVPRAVAAAEATLHEVERRSGVVVAHVGWDDTDVAIFRDGHLVELFTVPLGGRAVTRDAAAVLQASWAAAMVEDAVDTRARELARRTVQERTLALFREVRSRLDDLDVAGLASPGFVITGVGADLPGVVDVARQGLDLPVRIGVPEAYRMDSRSVDSQAAPALGLVTVQARTTLATLISQVQREVVPIGGESVEPVQMGTRSGVVPALGRWLREFVPLGEPV